MEFLKPSQISHCNRLLDILEESLFACDFSVMGAGKTWVSSVIGAETGLPLFVLGPRGSLTNWENIAKTVGARIIFTSTYESLRSVRGCQPKHGYLIRFDSRSGDVSFKVTEAFRDLIKDGLILVCDECQKIKNDSNQTRAVRTLVREILDYGGKSRLLFLSGSPFEEARHALNFFRLIGFVTQTKLYKATAKSDFIPLGLTELIENLNFLHPKDLEELVIKHSPFSKKNVMNFVFDAFAEIIVPHFSSAMPSPAMDLRKNVRNGYYLFEKKEEAQELIDAIETLRRITDYRKDDETVVYNHKNMGAVTISLMRIEQAKISLFHRRAREILEANKKAKVVIFVNYRETIDRLVQLLSEYDPVVYDGRLRNRSQENDAIDAFQDGPCRLFIGILKKGGYAINLHDTRGDEPRFTLISPTYSILDMHQASGRTYRQGLKSDADITVVYGEVGTAETRILESKILSALSRKTENLKRILVVQAKEGVLFPGDYPEFHESLNDSCLSTS